MKIQIYAMLVSIVWSLAVWRVCEEATRWHSSDLDEKATWVIMFGGVMLPLAGRVWGWW